MKFLKEKFYSWETPGNGYGFEEKNLYLCMRETHQEPMFLLQSVWVPANGYACWKEEREIEVNVRRGISHIIKNRDNFEKFFGNYQNFSKKLRLKIVEIKIVTLVSRLEPEKLREKDFWFSGLWPQLETIDHQEIFSLEAAIEKAANTGQQNLTEDILENLRRDAEKYFRKEEKN